MRKMLLALISVTFLSFLLIFGLVEATDNKAESHKLARDGILDLTDWNVQSNKVVPLDGQWEFYWNQLVEPGAGVEAARRFMEVPGFWWHKGEDGGMIAKGAATYRLLIKLKPSETVYGLRVSNIRMASEIYVNGHKVGQSGVPALSQSTYTYENKPYNAFFSVQGDTAEIIIHAANYENPQGGIPYEIFFGSAQGINIFNINSTILNLTLIASLIMLGCYQLGVYIIRREQKGLLYFGLSCIIIAWSFASNGDRVIVEHFHWTPELYYKIQAVSLYSSLIPMVLFIKIMCKGLISRRFLNMAAYGTGVYVAVVLFTPFQWYSSLNLPVSIMQVGVYSMIIIVLLHSYLRGKLSDFSKISLGLFILGLTCYVVGLIDYALYLTSLVSGYKLGYFAILSFCFLVSFLLSYRYSEAYKTIEQMADKLQEADRQKDEFLLQTSHEFQTPLHGIMNLSQAMLETAAGEWTANQMQNLNIIRDTSSRLSVLVHDILDMEKIKRNELTVQLGKVDVRMVVSLVFDLFQHVIAGKKIRLVNAIPEGLPFIYADENRLKQVLHNLIGNAAKFTQEGTITVSAQVLENRVKILVEDSGAGIDEADWDDIFQPFKQAHSPYEYGGTGLGLFISRKLLHLMDGEIRVEWSGPERGTCMAFTIPVDSESPDAFQETAATREAFSQNERQSPMESPQREAGGFTILAVDDEPANLQVLTQLFADEPYQLLWAAHGAEALELLRSRSDIDLVLLDVMMPKVSGLEVCREIRKQYSLFEMPVILLTVMNSANDIAAGFKAGANDFIVKPFAASEVRARTETLLQLKHSVEAALKAEIDFLQSQIKPHFLFNSLNSIIALCRTDGLRAEKLMTHLSYYLRRSFDHKPDHFVLVQDELQLVEAYAEIEKARFEERLHIEYDIDPDVLMKKILPLTIQPLVENAIRHGVMKKEDGGTVRLSVALENSRVTVEVWDNGVGLNRERIDRLWLAEDAVSKRRGVGLANITRRLRHFHSEELHVSSVEGEWTRVRFQYRI
ncbi:ATP-binding protein [Paenibacillus sp. NFR01]|uniref:ATP-binding protein n=1 Tax=Paenibacillus sp. NFR01 TaxID=1566279 RepID=UPI0008D1FD81|nr:ATP-binding protein [Paenibacillus sp. NFR01]SET06486.1 7TM diverse intracellular signalling [Paenibacillus sp. NFR01]